MAAPLQQFMSQLLQNCEGSVELIVDNARMATQHTVSIPLSLSSASSNHSTTRWDCIEPSSSLVVLDSSNRGRYIPKLQRRSPIVVSFGNNATPACPIRKLSKEDEVVEAANSPTAGGSSEFFPPLHRQDANGLFRIPCAPRDDATGRPPLSPTKKKKQAPAILKNKIQTTAHDASSTTRKKTWPHHKVVQVRLPTNSMARSTKGGAGPISTQMANRYSGMSSLPRDKLLASTKPSDRLLVRSPQTNPHARKPLKVLTFLENPARSLSKTLFGIGNTEQAPVQPRRIPSASPSPVSRPKPAVSMMRLSEHSHSTDATSASTLCSKPSVVSQASDENATIQPTGHIVCPQAPILAKNSRKRHMFSIRKLTERR